MNSHLPEPLRAALNPFAPQVQPLRRYMVRVIRSGYAVKQFEAMAPSSCECVMQHMDAYPDCKIEAIGMDEWRERAREARAMREEQRMNDAMRWANGDRS